TPVYEGEKLLNGNVIEGPAIIEERTTTVVIPDGFRCEVDPSRNYVLRQGGSIRADGRQLASARAGGS
ncbi:MAG: hypothetical protein KGJ86_17610, partial [Chloroflexota bacterium]|nr:hypothetical protein [Chloroflexota bacterium]